MKCRSMRILSLIMSVGFAMLTLYYFPNDGLVEGALIIITHLLPWITFTIISIIDENNTSLVGLIFLLVSFSILLYMREKMAYNTLDYVLVFKRVSVANLCLLLVFLAGMGVAKWLVGQWLLLVLLSIIGPLSFLAARIFCEPFNDTYNWIGPVMPSELSKISLVAVIPLVLQRSYNKAHEGVVKFLTIYFSLFLLLAGCANEYGTLLIILIFGLLTCLTDKSLNHYFVPVAISGVVVSLMAYCFSKKVRTRVGLFLMPWKAIMRGDEQAVVNKRILVAAQYSGYWGTDFRFTKYELPPNLSTDYAISTLMMDMGLTITVVVLVIYVAILMCIVSIKIDGILEKRMINAVIVVLTTAILISYAGNMLSFPLAGLSLPYITSISTIQPNVVFFFLTGLACGMRSNY